MTAVCPAQGVVPDPRLERGQIAGGQDPARALHFGGQRETDLAAVETLHTFLRDRLVGAREVGLHQPFAGERRPSVAQEDLGGGRKARQLIAAARDRHGERHGCLESVGRERDRRGEHGGERQAAVSAVGDREGAEHPGDGDGEVTGGVGVVDDGDLEPPSRIRLLRHRLAGVDGEHVRPTGPRDALVPVDDERLAGRGVVDHHVAASADPAHGGLDDRDRERRGDDRVDRVPTLLQDGCPGFGGQPVVGGDHAGA